MKKETIEQKLDRIIKLLEENNKTYIIPPINNPGIITAQSCTCNITTLLCPVHSNPNNNYNKFYNKK